MDRGIQAAPVTAAASGASPRAAAGSPTQSLRRKGFWALAAAAAVVALLAQLFVWYRGGVERDLAALDRLREAAVSDAAGSPQAAQLADGLAGRVDSLRERERTVTLIWTFAAAAGIGSVALVVLFHFGRLARDLETLRRRAAAVMAGDRGRAATRVRSDEVGELGGAFDSMADALAASERELEVQRRKAFHHEKMAAIGTVAAGVLHNIGNPIAAIDGVARAMKDAQDRGECRIGEGLCDPDLILQETARLQLVSRMIARLTAAPSTEVRLLNLNELVQTALMLLHFDVRLGGVRVDTEFEPQLPAITGVGDDLLQLVMNLLVNAGDAVLRARPVRPLIHVRTMFDPVGVCLSIADNGGGMSGETLQRGRNSASDTGSTGLDLALCRSIVEQHGGAIDIESTPGQGSRVTVRLGQAPARA